MGRVDTPVRKVLNYASEHFAADLPIVYVHTVVESSPDGLITRGLFIGDDSDCFQQAAKLSLMVNLHMLDEPLEKVIVYLSPEGLNLLTSSCLTAIPFQRSRAR